MQKVDIATAWNTFLLRYAFLGDTLAFRLGEDEAVSCEAVREVTASLLYVDLASVIDAALEAEIRRRGLQKSSTLNERINALTAVSALVDPYSLHAIRVRRNEIAHGLQRVSAVELENAVRVVEKELQALSLIGVRPRYIPFSDRSAWRRREPGGSLPYERDFSIGVQLAETAQPVLKYHFVEHVDSTEKPKLRSRAEWKGKGP